MSGQVVDNNGNPIPGAKVSVAGLAPVTTASDGTWRLTNVPVVNTVNNNGIGVNIPAVLQGTNTLQFIAVVVTAPAGYLSTATVYLTPNAQVISSESGSIVQGGQTNPQVTFIDGYEASTGAIRIPAISTSVRGTLADAATGGPLANKSVTLDFRSVQIDQPSGTAVVVAYGTGTILNTTTDTQGNFSFAPVADDSCYTLTVAGYTLAYGGATGPGVGCPLSVPPLPAISAPGVANINTINESSHSVVLAVLNATPVGTVDAIPPFVTKVDTLKSQLDNPGVLTNDGTAGIIVHLSEPSASGLTASDVLLLIGSPPNQQAATFAFSLLDASTIKLVPTNPIALGANVTVQMRTDAIKDSAGNLIVATVPGGNCGPGTTYPNVVDCPSFTDTAATANTPAGFPAAPAGFIDLYLTRLAPTSTAADSANLVQVNAQADSSSTAPYLSSNAFLDTVLGAAGFNNAATNACTSATCAGGGEFITAAATFPAANLEVLNAPVAILGTPPQTVTPLQALLTAVIPTPRTSNTGVARVTLTPPATNVPVDYVVFVTRGGVVIDSSIFPAGAATNVGPVCPFGGGGFGPACATPKAAGPAVSLGDGTFRYVIKPDPASPTAPFDLLITGVGATAPLMPGDHVVVESRASGGLLGGSFDLALVDNERPTVALQQLGAGTLPANLTVINASAGGALGAAAAGQHLVVYPVSPQSLDRIDPNVRGTPPANTGFNCDTLFQEMESSAYTAAEVGGLVTAANGLGGTGTIPNPCGTTAATSMVADATSTAAYFGSPGVTLAAAFTEPLAAALTGTPAFTSGNGTTLTFTGAGNGVLNNVSTEDGSIFSLVRFSVNDVRNFEADGRGAKVLDFCGTVTDVLGNSATCPAGADPGSNARLLIHDFKPPLMTKGYRTGAGLTFVFDEPITLPLDGSFISLVVLMDCAPPKGINLNADQSVVSPAGNRITLTGGNTVFIPISNPQLAGGLPTSCFTGGSHAYAEAAYTGITPTQPAAPNHGAVIYDGVQDTAGAAGAPFVNNRWRDWEGIGNGIGAPFFAAADLVGPFLVQAALNPPVCTGFTAGPAHDWNCQIRYTHPVYVGGLDADLGTDFDGDRADTTNAPGTGLSQTDLNTFCAAKYKHTSAANVVIADGPSSCVPVNGSGTVVSPTGNGTNGAAVGAYTPSDVAQFQGFVVNWTASVVATGEKFRLNPAGGNAAAGSHKTISSQFLIGSFSVTGYNTASLASSGVVVYSDGVAPQLGFEQLDAVAP